MIKDIIHIGEADFGFTDMYSGFFGLYLSFNTSKKKYSWSNINVGLNEFIKDYKVPDEYILVNPTLDVIQTIKDNGGKVNRYNWYWLDTMATEDKFAFYINLEGEVDYDNGNNRKCIVPIALVPTYLMEE